LNFRWKLRLFFDFEKNLAEPFVICFSAETRCRPMLAAVNLKTVDFPLFLAFLKKNIFFIFNFQLLKKNIK
jgi:hypothetical protein